MRIFSVEAKNFGSYKELLFKTSSRGLTLISGPNGAGKSTLCDLVPWALFGKTAKGGAADEVTRWNTEMTSVSVHFELRGVDYVVFRSRGVKVNDLWYVTEEGRDASPQRGKDLKDTQRLLNNILGMDVETYLAGAYLHEFSLASQFFTTTAKNRRVITEQLVDLTTATHLQIKSAEFVADVKTDISVYADIKIKAIEQLNAAKANLNQELTKAAMWQKQHEKNLLETKTLSDTFEVNTTLRLKTIQEQSLKWETQIQLERKSNTEYLEELLKQQIDEKALEKRIKGMKEEIGPEAVPCPHCGVVKDRQHDLVRLADINKLELQLLSQNSLKRNIYNQQRTVDRLFKLENPHLAQIETAKAVQNVHTEAYKQLVALSNPYADVTWHKEKIQKAEQELAEAQKELDSSKELVQDLEALKEILAAFRASLITQTVLQIETTTNFYLESHFDGELRVKFESTDKDKIDVNITKDGNLCSFTQLSKGQRQILKLAFGISVMRAVANHKGLNFNVLFFDEALDGMSDIIKAKAYTLLESLALEYENIFVVDHSEAFKSLFLNSIDVELVEGVSTIL